MKRSSETFARSEDVSDTRRCARRSRYRCKWYEEQRQGLGQDLLVEFRERLQAALETPGTGVRAGVTPGGSEIRRYRLERFKRYAILLATIRQEPTVLAFEHSSRRPSYWRDRLKSG